VREKHCIRAKGPYFPQKRAFLPPSPAGGSITVYNMRVQGSATKAVKRLASVLARGAKEGVLHLRASAKSETMTLMATVHGAMLAARAYGDAELFRPIVQPVPRDPHFMFNTLNSIASLVYDQRGDAAVGMIVGLSGFLRRASKGLGNRLDRSREILCVPAPGRRHAHRAQDHPGTRAGPAQITWSTSTAFGRT
jgi:hypothetical protein